MKVVLLTTETLHHMYFLREVCKVYPIAHTICETSSGAIPKFDVAHSFEEKREKYELNLLSAGEKRFLDDCSEVTKVESINDDQSASCLKTLSPDVVIVFGTRKLSSSIIRICPNGMVNLHGGDPERYRGLDSHLWAIYHGDFSSLITCAHRVNEELDDGEIILQAALEIKQGMQIEHLRAENTKKLIQVTISAIDMFQRNDVFTSIPQRKKGRYYSYMPTCFKEICEQKFLTHTANLV